MSEAKKHAGGCHCGRVRFEVETDLERVIECNCSHCSKKGFLLSFVPAGSFRLLCGADALREYQFNKKLIHHLFCETCGIQAFGRGPGKAGETVAINVRCLDDVDLDAVGPTPFDGKSL